MTQDRIRMQSARDHSQLGTPMKITTTEWIPFKARQLSLRLPAWRNRVWSAEVMSTIGLTLCCMASVRARAGPLDTWHWRNPQPGLNTLLSVAYGGGRFVAVGLLGTVSTSSD